MKTAIIGAGNMGGALAKGLASSGKYSEGDIRVSNRSEGKLLSLKESFPGMVTTLDNREAVKGADVVVLAVKPYLIEGVISGIRSSLSENQIIVSLAAGITLNSISALLPFQAMPVFRVIPNTAMKVGESMTLLCCRDAESEHMNVVEGMFSLLGRTMFIPEKEMDAATALSSCGIAYALKFIEAGMTAGVHMGITPKESKELVAQAMAGAAKIILEGDSHPGEEILKVCTPGGLTIKGVKALEDGGFPSAVIAAMMAAKN
jgi:pyrroline-5-carboxylate reductase